MTFAAGSTSRPARSSAWPPPQINDPHRLLFPSTEPRFRGGWSDVRSGLTDTSGKSKLFEPIWDSVSESSSSYIPIFFRVKYRISDRGHIRARTLAQFSCKSRSSARISNKDRANAGRTCMESAAFMSKDYRAHRRTAPRVSGQPAESPPSITNSAPVTKRDSSEAR